MKFVRLVFLSKAYVSFRLQGPGSDPAECLQALKGVSLRSETYSQDGTDKAGLPFMISQLSYDVELVQPRGSNKHSVAQMNTREKLSIQNERNMQDPRTTHGIILKTNSYDDVEESLQIVCPRTEQAALDDVNKNQKARKITLTHSELVRPRSHGTIQLSQTASVEAARAWDPQLIVR